MAAWSFGSVDAQLPDLLGKDPESYLRSGAGRGLASLLEAMLSRVEGGEPHAAADVRLEDPTDRARALHCRLLGLSDGGEAGSVSLVLHDLTPHLDSLGRRCGVPTNCCGCSGCPRSCSSIRSWKRGWCASSTRSAPVPASAPSPSG